MTKPHLTPTPHPPTPLLLTLCFWLWIGWLGGWVDGRGGGGGWGVAWGQSKPPTVRIAVIDPLSGPAGDVGRNSLQTWQFVMRELGQNKQYNPYQIPIVVAGFDNRHSPQESVTMLKAAIDQGFRIIVQGHGSGIAVALNEMVVRHNRRYPKRQVLLLNYAAMDPQLTNERCSHWHFRLDADTLMRLRALTQFVANKPQWQQWYVVNQDGANGQFFAKQLSEWFALERLPMRLVGNALHPAFGGDFVHLAQRIKTAKADAVITANWGQDLRGLIQALHQAGVRVPVFTFFAALHGTPRLLAQLQPTPEIYHIASYHDQMPSMQAIRQRFYQQTGQDLVQTAVLDGGILLLAALTDVWGKQQDVSAAHLVEVLGGRNFVSFDGAAHMRAQDHQLQKGVYVNQWQAIPKKQGTQTMGAEQTAFHFVPRQYFDADHLQSPIHCDMTWSKPYEVAP